MERILAYYAPNLSMDINSLREAAEELQNQHRGSDSDGPDTHVGIDDLEDLAIDDEDFTIRALPDNTTRMSFMFIRAGFRFWFLTRVGWHLQSTPGNFPISTSP